MSTSKRQTFADIVAEVRRTPARLRCGRYATRPGQFNGAGELFDPDGHLVEILDFIDFEVATGYLESGALVVHETSGCPGSSNGPPIWYDGEERRRMTATGLRPGSSRYDFPWIELCRAGERDILFLHGDIVWGTGRVQRRTSGTSRQHGVGKIG